MHREATLVVVASIALASARAGIAARPDSPRGADEMVKRAAAAADRAATVSARMALAEVLRAAGQRDESLRVLDRAARLKADARQAADVHALACWRRLPSLRVERADLRRAVAALAKQAPHHRWLNVFRLYLAAVDRDRTALLAAARAASRAAPPGRFPDVPAEKAHLELLRQAGASRTRAGLDVIGHRSFAPLHALRELDRVLTREADAAGGSDAAALRGARDRLRKAYLAASRNLLERLFALRLLGRGEEAERLLDRAEGLKWLTDRDALAAALEGLDDEQAWRLIVAPMLAGDLKLIESPPNLSRAAPKATGTMAIQADRKLVRDGAAHYEGSVRIRLEHLTIHCEKASVVPPEKEGGAVLVGSGNVVVRGVPGRGTVTAESFTFNSALGSFTFAGNVQIAAPSGALRADSVTVKLRACTITATGKVADRRSLLGDFAAASNIRDKLALLGRIQSVYKDDELPAGVRYLLALDLLRRHMTWHLPPRRSAEERKVLRDVRPANEAEWRWADAHTGEPWMIELLDEAEKARLRRLALAAAATSRPGESKVVRELRIMAAEARLPALYWRLKDPGHADVARARKLLQGVDDKDVRPKAQRWIAEIERNNTVVTFDVPGGYARSRKGPVVMDVRNADEVDLRLYRLRTADDLLAVTDRIGRDFIYRDYDLQFRQPVALVDRIVCALERLARLESARRPPAPLALEEKDLVGRWHVLVAELGALPRHLRRRYGWSWGYDEWDLDEESRYFRDGCHWCGDRLRKRYRSDGRRRSAWVCDRVVWVPAKHLAQAGAYALVGEANGRRFVAPIVVDPLSLTMRRCRDGVFVLVSNAKGDEPAAGARVFARDMIGNCVTDENGAGFLRVFAEGGRAIVAAKDGRFAVGGFGRVFEGIYVSRLELSRRPRQQALRALRELRAVAAGVRVFSGGHVAAAYTDRPTYRPGQTVRFKLIVRRLPTRRQARGEGGAQEAGPAKPKPAHEFRADEFGLASRLELPADGTQLRYDVVNPRGRAVTKGTLRLNDYGTAAGEFRLLSEAATGIYALRLLIDGRTRVLPDVFAVKYYRRPNFTLDVAGLPEKIHQAGSFRLSLTGRYYFGKPLAAGEVEARLVDLKHWRAISRAEATLDDEGRGELALRVPATLAAGDYAVICTLTDPTHRVVSKSLPCRIELPQTAAPRSDLAKLPRFAPKGTTLTVRTNAKKLEVYPRPPRGSKKEAVLVRSTVPVRDGSAEVRLDCLGWHRVEASGEHADVFVYGGTKPPDRLGAQYERADEERPPADDQRPEWIDLTLYGGEESREYCDKDYERWDRAWDSDRLRLRALLGRQHARVGGTLPVLVYVPFERARLLFTLEGRTVVDYVVRRPAPGKGGGYRVVEIPIKARHVPNFYLRGRVLGSPPPALLERPPDRVLREAVDELEQEKAVEDDSEDPHWCRIDVIDPDAPPGREKLRVAVETDRRDCRPGEDVGVVLRVTDLEGKPRAAELSLGAVDESVYTFGEDPVASLAARFSNPRPPRRYLPKRWRSAVGTKWAVQRARAMAQMGRMEERLESLQAAAPRASRLTDLARMEHLSLRAAARPPRRPPPAALGEMPATTLARARLRTDFRETAAWLPQLRAGADGVVRTRFRLPDSLTAYRLTAVALTKKTEIGTARAKVRSRLPLSVQVFLPRFAVESDRLLAVALVHNNTDRPRTCEAAWEVSGAGVGKPSRDASAWRTERAAGTAAVSGRVAVPASGTARVGLWLKPDQAGRATVSFRAADGRDADGERRVLPVQPLGRRREVILSGELNKTKWLHLPRGFVARELVVTVARCRAADGLNGLGYLVAYPHGCVEQTMSRFLPAVTVKHAVSQTAAALPADVARTLPHVIARGLARLYNFQHADGGWGWWQNDKTNDAMTAYVVYGLARCRLAGTHVDADALRRGCAYLNRRLADAGPRAMKPEVAARAWLAIVLAGRADGGALADCARAALKGKRSAETRCNLALACHDAAQSEWGQRLWATIDDWSPDAARPLAMKLSAQMAYGAPLADCRATADKLLDCRRGHRWANTLATSWAVQALAEMIRYARAAEPAKAVKITVADKTVLDLTEPDELRQLVYRARVGADVLEGVEATEIRIVADAAGGASYAVTAIGTQRLDRVEPIGTAVRISRRYTTLDGRPIRGPIQVGTVFAARLTVELAKRLDYSIIEDRRPAGCEFAEDRVFGPDATSAAHVEFRDDRLCVFHTRLSPGRHEIVYYLRAETPGTHHVLPGRAYPMYDENTRGETGAAIVEVRSR